jgi:Domain of unknown function (DUF1877)
MAGRGVHFAITLADMNDLLSAPDDDHLMKIVERVEAAWDVANIAETDKAWNAIHRCLTDGSLLYDGGTYPLNLVICGGRQLHKGDDYTIALVTPGQVKDAAAAIETVTEAWMRDRYFSLIKPAEYDGEHGDEDFAYTWEWFGGLRELFLNAASRERAVIFTVDA